MRHSVVGILTQCAENVDYLSRSSSSVAGQYKGPDPAAAARMYQIIAMSPAPRSADVALPFSRHRAPAAVRRWVYWPADPCPRSYPGWCCRPLHPGCHRLPGMRGRWVSRNCPGRARPSRAVTRRLVVIYNFDIAGNFASLVHELQTRDLPTRSARSQSSPNQPRHPTCHSSD